MIREGPAFHSRNRTVSSATRESTPYSAEASPRELLRARSRENGSRNSLNRTECLQTVSEEEKSPYNNYLRVAGGMGFEPPIRNSSVDLHGRGEASNKILLRRTGISPGSAR